MKMLLDCIIRMWLLMPVENGSTWSLFLRILPDCKLVNDVNNELLDVDFICFGGFWHFLKLNGDIQVQLACSCSAGELRVAAWLSSDLRWQAGEGEAIDSVIIWLLKTLLRNKFGVFETKRWLFRLIMMESNQILTKFVVIVIGWRCRGWRNGSVGFWRHSDPTYKLASRVTIETSCKFWGKMRCSRS